MDQWTQRDGLTTPYFDAKSLLYSRIALFWNVIPGEEFPGGINSQRQTTSTSQPANVPVRVLRLYTIVATTLKFVESQLTLAWFLPRPGYQVILFDYYCKHMVELLNNLVKDTEFYLTIKTNHLFLIEMLSVELQTVWNILLTRK